jgi:hypothetical protein
MGLDCTFGPAQCASNVLVGFAANDKFEDFPLARRQCRDMSANHGQLALQAKRHFMSYESPFNCTKKVVGRYGLSQKVICTRLNGLLA